MDLPKEDRNLSQILSELLALKFDEGRMNLEQFLWDQKDDINPSGKDIGGDIPILFGALSVQPESHLQLTGAALTVLKNWVAVLKDDFVNLGADYMADAMLPAERKKQNKHGQSLTNEQYRENAKHAVSAIDEDEKMLGIAEKLIGEAITMISRNSPSQNIGRG